MADRRSVKARWNEARLRSDSGISGARVADDDFAARMTSESTTHLALDDGGEVVGFAHWIRGSLLSIPVTTAEAYYSLMVAFADSCIAQGVKVCRATVDDRPEPRERGWASRLRSIRYKPIGFAPVAKGPPKPRKPKLFLASADAKALRAEAMAELQALRRQP